MRQTTSIMLQQNNNNNYPCLNVTGSTREMLQKCSRTSLPFPSRLELGLGDLPLIRGLRAWVLCSKNRCKAGGLLGGGQAPTAPPAGHGSLTSCPRPADVYLSREWGRMGYGLPLGLDARQPGIGALVTVATLKTSEGSGKTQTQCLFLRTEKGSCLYSTEKPGSGATGSAASSVVGGWLRGKTGGGGRRDTTAGRRDNGPTLPAQTGVNRVRVRSGRRWRKSGNAAGHEKTGVSRERQQRRGEDPAGETQEEKDKGGLESKQFPSPQQDGRRGRQEREGACRSPRCCHNVSPETRTQCRGRAQRRESQEEGEGSESQRRDVFNRLHGEVKEMRKERQKNEEEEEEKGGLCELEPSHSVLAVPDLDPESKRFHPQSACGSDGEEIREASSNEELKTQTSHSKGDCSDCEIMKMQTGNNNFIHSHSTQSTDEFNPGHDRGSDSREPAGNSCEETVASAFPESAGAGEESESEMGRVALEEEEKSISQTPADFSVGPNCYEAVSTRPASISTAGFPESSTPVEGSICTADPEARWVGREQQSSHREHLEGCQPGEVDPGVRGKEGLDTGRFKPQEPNAVRDEINTVKPQLSFFLKIEEDSSQLEEREASSSPLRHKDPSIFGTENCCDSRTVESERREELESEEERLDPEEAEEIWRSEHTCEEPDNGEGDDVREQQAKVELNVKCKIQEDSNIEGNNRRLQESADDCRGKKKDEEICGETNISHVEENGASCTNVSSVSCADPSTSLALSLANPDPFLPLLGSMATSLACLEEEEEEEEAGVFQATAGEGGQEGKRRHGRELEERDNEERSSTVATAEGKKEEEEEEDEFGVFMYAEGQPAWSGGFTMSATVPCGSRESVALGNHAGTGESTHWTAGWTDSSFHQSDDAWTAFPQDSSDEGQDVAGQWWPTSAVEQRKDRLLANQNLVAVFAEAFPSLPGSSSGDSCDHEAVPTLTQLLRGRASQDQGLLDSFHDLNKMIGQRYKRASGVSRDLLLKTLHLEQPHTESRPAPWTANRRLSPGLPSANQHAQNAAAKRRLSYDYNRNIME